mgnify:CR=1 FL=1
MTHEIKTNGITILFVEVPEDATRFVTDWKFLIVDIFSPTQKMIPIPEGQYQILGKSTELSEEQMKEICEFRFGNQSEYLEAGFIDYNTPVRNGFGDKYILNKETVQESYLSLLEANGIDNNKIHLVLKRI